MEKKYYDIKNKNGNKVGKLVYNDDGKNDINIHIPLIGVVKLRGKVAESISNSLKKKYGIES